MEFLQIILFLLAAIIIFVIPRARVLAVLLALAGCAILVGLEFYVNLWTIVPIGNL
ncbi:hypothetical protein [Campylobacter sp. 19-13652]|uniref:hypothetical protein n=1 Tax=Campylobacter sp. 19-13652 TaxID=2840180 RepID=UPI001C73F3CD|nr:hypothetical protein [Campylobacter sp. 19-13652]BCX79939.1 hypothetical protein LBC_14010 [Campylobacter sp. 19-13652]